MVTHAHSGEDREASAWGPVTAGEREARWGHRGGVLELQGPRELIDSIERSFFSVGAALARVNAEDGAYLLQPGLLDALCHLQTQSGLLTIVARQHEGSELIARAEGRSVTVDPSESMRAIAAIHQLLHQVGLLISAEGANL
jgi:hypothetical protein